MIAPSFKKTVMNYELILTLPRAIADLIETLAVGSVLTFYAAFG